MSGYVKAKNFDTALKHAVRENLAGGTLQVEVVSCSNLVAADGSPKIDPSVKLIFSSLFNQQQGTTEVVSQSRSPVFKSHNKYEFNVIDDKDKLRIEVADRHIFPIPRHEMVAACETVLGPGSKAGGDGTLVLNLHEAKAKGEDADADKPGSRGQVTIRFFYNFSATANTHAATDITAEQEELDYSKLIDVAGRFSAHLGYMCNPMWYWLETCMWVRPFESAFWCLVIFCSVFVFDNLISAWFPGLMFICFVKKYTETVKAAGRPKVEEEVPPFDWRECARTTQINLTYYCDMLDWWHEVYAWGLPDTAMLLTKVFGGWTFAILFFPFPSLRYWFFLLMCYMYVLYPMYINSPRLMSIHMEKVSSTLGNLNLRNFELYVMPYLPPTMQGYVPKSKAREMEAWLEEELPPLPAHPMTYDEWKRYNNERDNMKCMLELKKDKFLDTRGDPEVPATEGRLEVTVVSATGFKIDENGTCDPYVQLALGPQRFDTTVKKKTVSPVWDETFEFLEVGYQSGVLSIGFWDKNMLTTDYALGSCQLKLCTVVRDVSKLIELPLVGKAADGASVALKVKGIGPAWPNDRQQQLLNRMHDVQEEKKKIAMSRPADTRIGTLEVVLLYGAGLKACDLNTSDPYCLLSITNHPSSSNPKQSSVKDSTLKPVWNETFVFTSVACKMNLCIRAMDKDRVGNDDLMGNGVTPLADLFDGIDEEVEIPIKYKERDYGVIAVKLRATGFGRLLPKDNLRALGTPQKESITREASPSISPPPMSPPKTESPFMHRMEAARPPSMQPMQAQLMQQPMQTQQPQVQQQPQAQRPQAESPVPKAPVPAVAPTVASPDRRPSTDTGKLSVTVLSARSLAVSDSSCLVKVLLTSSEIGTRKFKTRPVIAGTANPIWNVMFTFDSLPKGILATCQLQVEVWDSVKSELLAAGISNLSVLQESGSMESWVMVYNQGVASGEVKLILAPQGL